MGKSLQDLVYRWNLDVTEAMSFGVCSLDNVRFMVYALCELVFKIRKPMVKRKDMCRW